MLHHHLSLRSISLNFNLAIVLLQAESLTPLLEDWYFLPILNSHRWQHGLPVYLINCLLPVLSSLSVRLTFLGNCLHLWLVLVNFFEFHSLHWEYHYLHPSSKSFLVLKDAFWFQFSIYLLKLKKQPTDPLCPIMPNKDSFPPFYRGCWPHEVSRELAY